MPLCFKSSGRLSGAVLCCAAAAQVFYRERAARMYDPLALGIGKDKARTHKLKRVS